jgi:hypothetical protein
MLTPPAIRLNCHRDFRIVLEALDGGLPMLGRVRPGNRHAGAAQRPCVSLQTSF